MTTGLSRECDITFCVEGRPRSAQRLRESTVAPRRVQSVTVPSSRVTRKYRSPELRSPLLKMWAHNSRKVLHSCEPAPQPGSSGSGLRGRGGVSREIRGQFEERALRVVCTNWGVPLNSPKRKFSARISRGRPGAMNFGQKSFGLIFRSLHELCPIEAVWV